MVRDLPLRSLPWVIALSDQQAADTVVVKLHRDLADLDAPDRVRAARDPFQHRCGARIDVIGVAVDADGALRGRADVRRSACDRAHRSLRGCASAPTVLGVCRRAVRGSGCRSPTLTVSYRRSIPPPPHAVAKSGCRWGAIWCPLEAAPGRSRPQKA